jgi:hypothetical protein
MKHLRLYVTWGLALLAVLLSPVIVILSLVVAIGIGLDIIDATGEWPLALVLCAPGIFMLLRPLWPTGLTHRFAVALSHAHLHLPALR